MEIILLHPDQDWTSMRSIITTPQDGDQQWCYRFPVGSKFPCRNTQSHEQNYSKSHTALRLVLTDERRIIIIMQWVKHEEVQPPLHVMAARQIAFEFWMLDRQLRYQSWNLLVPGTPVPSLARLSMQVNNIYNTIHEIWNTRKPFTVNHHSHSGSINISIYRMKV